jgi:hypothetical protein
LGAVTVGDHDAGDAGVAGDVVPGGAADDLEVVVVAPDPAVVIELQGKSHAILIIGSAKTSGRTPSSGLSR